MNIKKWLAGAPIALAVAFCTYCSGGGPTTPRPTTPPLPSIIAGFPGAEVVGTTITIVEGDSLRCAFSLVPENASVLLGLSYDEKSVICFRPGWATYQLVFWGDGGAPVIATTGSHSLELQLYAPGGAKLGDPVTYTLVVLPRPEGQLMPAGTGPPEGWLAPSALLRRDSG